MFLKKNMKGFNFLLWRSFRLNRRGVKDGESFFSYGGFALSIAILTTSLILLSSYQKTLKEGLLGVNSHLYIFNPIDDFMTPAELAETEYFLNNKPEVESYSLVKQTQVMGVNDESVKGLLVRSIEWERDDLPIEYHKFIKGGSGNLVGAKDVVLGIEAAKTLGVKVGDEFRLVSPTSLEYTLFGLKMGEERVRVAGLFQSGIYDTDSNIIFLNGPLVSKLLANGDNYSLIEVKLGSEYVERANELQYMWTRELDFSVLIHSWIDFNGNLFRMLIVQRWVIFIILSFIVLIAAFNIISSTTTSILERRKELAILKSVGCNDSFIHFLVLSRVLVIGLLSVIGGILFGILFAFLLTKQTLYTLQGDVYFIERFSFHIDFFFLFLIFVVSLTIVFFTALVPLKKTSQLTITEILRNG
ncbi:MAG: FtsX-like permease family protein [Candidatus Cloacimonas sp.]